MEAFAASGVYCLRVLLCKVTFATPVTGLDIGDLLILGTDYGGLTGSGAQYELVLIKGSSVLFENFIQIVPESGVILPPNRGAELTFYYNVIVTVRASCLATVYCKQR